MIPRPTRTLQAGLHYEQNQAGNPGDLREHNGQNGGFTDQILSPRERATKVQGKRTIGKVGRNQPRPSKRGQDKRQRALHRDEREKKLAVNLDERTGSAQSLQKSQVVSCINDQQARQRIEKTQHKESGLQLRSKQFSPGIPKQNQAARPRRSEWTHVRRVNPPVDSHLSSPSLSGKCLPEYPGGN